MSKKFSLIIIDPQVDFCSPDGALYVKGAEKSMERLANFIDKHAGSIDQIFVTLDSHPFYHIANVNGWKGVDPFSVVSSSDIEKSSLIGLKEMGVALEADNIKEYLSKHFPEGITVWPNHCIAHTHGATIFKPIETALNNWRKTSMQEVVFFTKGDLPFVEEFATYKLDLLPYSHDYVIAGEAGSHCVKASLEIIADCFRTLTNVTYLSDCIDPVPSFEYLMEESISFGHSLGMKLATTEDYQ